MSEVINKVNDAAGVRAALLAEVEALRAAKRNTVIGTAVLAALMLTYLTWIYGKIGQVIEPEMLAGIVQAKVRDTLPQVEGKIAYALRNDAPRAADQAFDVLEAKLPEVRQSITGYIEDKVESAFRGFETKFESTFAQELTDLRKQSIQKHLAGLAEKERREVIAKDAVAELERRYREDTLTKLLPEFFESWTTVTAEKAIGTFRERLQAFDVELQKLCDAPDEKLSQGDRERKEMVLCLTAYLESLFASEGERIIDRIFYLMETSGKKMSIHFSGKPKLKEGGKPEIEASPETGPEIGAENPEPEQK